MGINEAGWMDGLKMAEKEMDLRNGWRYIPWLVGS